MPTAWPSKDEPIEVTYVEMGAELNQEETQNPLHRLDPLPISGLIPVRNGEPYIEASIMSLVDQTAPLSEIVVVDDGSTDNSAAIVRALSESCPQVRLVTQEPTGLVSALNHGLAEAREPWIARLDADDLSYAHRIETQWSFLAEHPDLLLVGCGYEFIDHRNRSMGISKHLPMTEPERFDPMRDPNVPHQGVLYSRQAVLSLGGYRERVPAEDLDLWLRLSEVGSLGYVDEVLIGVRVLAEGISAERFVDQRRMWAYVRHCAAERRVGRPEPDFTAWQHNYRPSRAKQRRWSAQRNLRLGAALMAEGRTIAGIASFARAAIKSPRAVWRKGRSLSLNRRR